MSSLKRRFDRQNRAIFGLTAMFRHQVPMSEHASHPFARAPNVVASSCEAVRIARNRSAPFDSNHQTVRTCRLRRRTKDGLSAGLNRACRSMCRSMDLANFGPCLNPELEFGGPPVQRRGDSAKHPRHRDDRILDTGNTAERMRNRLPCLTLKNQRNPPNLDPRRDVL